MITPAWRVAAGVSGLAWLLTSTGLVLLALTGAATAGPYSAWAFPLALAAGVPVLTLLRLLGTDPPAQEFSLRISLWLGLLMLAASWAAWLLR
ncbi:hypothetical protein BH20ACT5_BH20ACT5_18770 [soil metagenome]